MEEKLWRKKPIQRDQVSPSAGQITSQPREISYMQVETNHTETTFKGVQWWLE